MEKSNIVASSLTIKLSDFEGPMDLLLHLIKKSELDIFDLPIATITAQYLAFIHAQQEMQLDVASEYLVMAATLVQIKSADLLPQETYDDPLIEADYIDPRDELMQQLLTYKQFQVASAQLREREQTALPPVFAAACVWGRRDAVKVTLERIGALGGGDLSAIETTEGMLPSVLGPVPIPQPRTIDSRELEGTADRVKAVVRVPQSRRGELALRLRSASALHVAAREPGELRFQLDPKERI